MNIAMIGTGYVGLVTGSCFAETGNDVVCVDIDEAKIAQLRQGRVPFYELGLEELIQRNTREGRLSFSTDLAGAVRRAETIFIAVGTPQVSAGGADLSQVFAVAENIAEAMNGAKIVVTKSTVPVGTAARVREIIEARTGHPVAVVSNPEFLKEGAAVEDFMKPDRVVLGGEDVASLELLSRLYEPFVRTGKPIIRTDSRSAEMSKYAANAILATKISFINETARLCEKEGADIEQVRRIVGLDHRIGPHFIFPGIGFGGSCLPKDIRAMIAMGGEELEMPLLRAVDRVNETQKGLLLDKVTEHFDGTLADRTLALWGLAFKARTDDMREAPSIRVIDGLLDAGARVRAFDPEAMPEARKRYGDRIAYGENNYEAAGGADAVLVLTEWNEFRSPDFPRLKTLLRQPVLFDGRNLYDPAVMRRHGFTYYSIGRGRG
ncbi:MAG: UDP-glucose/GDP-mannose dehydrogenase family protein [Deltaproteobacteria bacterium]|nr:UDP-glucose/GDP-mannose dehydrogenase family protein [Deltaproteobacteria bacterium]